MSPKTANKFLLVVVLLASVVLSGCASQNLVSTSQEVEIGREAAAQVEAQYPVNRDPRLNALVNQVGNNVLRHVNVRSGITYTFKVLDISDVNAFSLPGGWIYVNRGLIDATRGNTDQLAGVIAHEIGHVQAKHAAEMISRQQIYGIAIGVLTRGNTAQIASVFANLNLLHWSRKEEYEADRLAVDYLLPSPYNAQGIISFFQVLLREQGEGRTPSFLRTHPLTSDRIERLQEYINSKRGTSRTR